MKIFNITTNAVLALVAAIVISISAPVNAEETGFTLEDSIRSQIFLELKSNVRELYQSDSLLVPSIDTSIAARVASTDANSKFMLPVNESTKAAEKNETAGKLN